MKSLKLILLGTLLWVSDLAAQQVFVISGRVTDANTGDPVPFANLIFKGTNRGTTTNFDGYYSLKASSTSDSLVISYIGYLRKAKWIDPTKTTQTIDFQLEASAYALKEVRISAGENPAFAILRSVIANKDRNDKRSLDAYEYESYNKIEFDVDNISEKFRQRKAVKQITGVIDKLDKVYGEDGKPIVPLFLSETISKYHYQRNPLKTKEIIVKTHVNGPGVEDASTVSQFTGSSFQQYNFYQNWLNIFQKDFASPIGDGWKTYYEYFLADSTWIDDYWCYEIEVNPKRKEELAFVGKIWIDSKSYALVQTDLTMTNASNINYIEKFKIQQELVPTSAGPWLPAKTRILIDVAEITKNAAGMLVKFYTSNRNYAINQARNAKFFDTSIELDEQYKNFDKDYWRTARHDSLSEQEKTVLMLIDSVKAIPIVRTYAEIFKIVAGGYLRIYEGVDYGPFLASAAANSIEGVRIRIGLRTNADFSRKWVFSGYGAIGTKDGRFKYSLDGRYILSRKPWMNLGASVSYDLERIGLTSEAVGNNSLFAAYSRFGTYRKGFFQGDQLVYFQGEIKQGFNQMIGLRHRSFDPMFAFSYTGSRDDGFYNQTELVLESKFAKDETFIQNDNERISLGADRFPVVTLRYSLGLKNVFGGDFSYHKFSLKVDDSFRLGIMGRSNYTVQVGYTPSTLPYPSLYPHLGNESWFYVGNAYNLMNFYEFISDQFVSLRYEHNFEGLLFNRLPAIKKLKWRTLATANVLYGGVNQRNLSFNPAFQVNDNAPLGTIGVLEARRPYVEVGYGIDNIFRFFRVQAVHRLTYTERPGVSKFAIKASAYFTL